ncbi:MAG: hypothetical protein GF416_08455 [Candidatus Altiarchaeales archaeon]|nr:hypothetical protein [Candidatus Altiarchaeales archaeon]MBD3417146.1 hypothetical protein [Candidatus Altiarchaeales archaeon]
MKWWALIFCALLLAEASSAATTSAYQESFEVTLEQDLRGEVLYVKAVDLDEDGEREILTNSLFITNYGKSGTVYALYRDGSERWKYFAGLLENSYTTDNGYTIVGAGPYAEYVGPSGANIWKRGTRTSQMQRIYSQTVYAADLNSDGKDDAVIGTNLGMKGSFVHVKDSGGDELSRIAFKSLNAPNVLHSTDLNGDGNHEIIVGTVKYAPDTTAGTYNPVYNRQATLEVYDLDGELKWEDLFDGAVTSLTSCDLDGDGLTEVVAGGTNSVVAYTPTGQRLWTADAAGQVNALDCGDIDGDGTLDVAVGANRAYMIKNGGEHLWSYNSGDVSSIDIVDLGSDGKPEVLVASSTLRILDSIGKILYKSDSFNNINHMDAGDLDGDGFLEVVLACRDSNVRVVSTRRYSEEVSADHFYSMAEREYTRGDYNLTAYYAKRAEEIYDSLGKNMDVVKAQSLYDKATGYSSGDHYLNITRYYFDNGDYGEAVVYADKALEEYRKLTDLRKLNEVNEIKKKAELIPNAESNLNLSRKYFGERDWVNASSYASKAQSAYSYLGDGDLEAQAESILATSNLYLEYYQHLDAAYNYSEYNDYGNASQQLQMADEIYLKLNDTAIRPQYENVSGRVSAIKRDEEVLVYGGLGVVALLAILLILAVALFAAYFFQKGGLAAVASALEDYGLWFTEVGVWMKDSVSHRPRMEGRPDREGHKGGLRGLGGGSGESIGDGFRR